MTLTIGTSGGNKTPYDMTVGTASGNKTVTLGYIGTSGGNELFFSADPIVTAAPTSQSGTGALGNYAFSATTATVLGGIGPYTYLWSYTVQSLGTFSLPGGDTTATVTPSVVLVAPGDLATATLICTVTDTTTGNTGVSNDVSLSYQRS